MATVVEGLPRDGDGRPVLSGCSVLPPMDDETGGRVAARRTAGEPQRIPLKGARRKTADRFAVLNGFVDCSLGGLSRGELATWLVLYRDTRNGTAATSQADISRRAGLTVRGVQKAVAKLTRRGLVVVVYRGGLNRGSSRYRVEPLANRGSG